MNVLDSLLWGFVGAIVLTTLMAAGRWLRLTRMSIPFMLGTMLTADLDRARLYGFAMNLVAGWLLAFVYAAVFESWGVAGWWRGAGIGLIHAAAVLVAGMQVLPGLHPRMASERQGPTPTRLLEPPGFLALNYGRRTPLAVIAAHLAFGTILGTFYRVT